jgi:hypothetical protein
VIDRDPEFATLRTRAAGGTNPDDSQLRGRADWPCDRQRADIEEGARSDQKESPTLVRTIIGEKEHRDVGIT